MNYTIYDERNNTFNGSIFEILTHIKNNNTKKFYINLVSQTLKS
jgi:hypothetical protein